MLAPVFTGDTLPRVLIVDDEPGIRFALQRWFSRQGWSVLEAADGALGLELLRNSCDADASRIDVVICDLHLPKLSGEALYAAVADERPALSERIILSTGDAIAARFDDADANPFRHILQKPFELSALRALVDSIVSATDSDRSP